MSKELNILQIGLTNGEIGMTYLKYELVSFLSQLISSPS